MSIVVKVDTAGGSTQFDEHTLPLSVGPGAGASLPVPGADLPELAAFIGHTEGRYYVQPAPRATGLEINGEPLLGSRWLEVGDRVLIGDATLQVRGVDPDLHLELQESEDVTAPPLLVDEPERAPPEPAEERLTAVDFRRDAPPPPPEERRRRVGRSVVVYGLLGILAVFAWFVFTAKPVRIEVDPATAEVEVRGGLLRWRLSDHYLLRPGGYQVLAEHPEYEPLTADLEVTGEGPDRVRLEMLRLPDALGVTTPGVESAEVFVDGELIGTTPVENHPLRAGSYVVRVEAERYKTAEPTIEIQGGGNTVDLPLTLEPDWAVVSLETEPPGAEVQVADEVVGVTPLDIELLSGAHEVVISQDGFKTWSERIDIVAGEDQALTDIVLEPADARLRVVSQPDGAGVLLDGQYVGRTPLELSLEGGKAHRVQLSRAGFQDARRSITLGSGESRTLRVDMTGKTGRVRVEVFPEEAEVLVDGRPARPENGVLELTAVPHKIEARAPGYAGKSVTVTPKPGFEQRVSLRLMTEAEARAASIKQVITTGQGVEMRLVQPGRFTMGSSRRDQGRRSNESLRQVQLTRPFYVALTETTNGQYREFDGKHNSGVVGGMGLEGTKYPVTNVTWDQAARYCNWLSRKDGLPEAYQESGGRMLPVTPANTGYRLPTEAEWVWAVRFGGRAGQPPRYPWGPKMPPTGKAGNYADESARPTAGRVIQGFNDGFPVSAPVGSFPASGLGLTDGGGNVAEWTNDLYGVYPGGSGTLVTDPTGAESGEFHVIRGSSWMHSSITELRWTFRDYGNKARPDVGFRIVRNLE